MANRYFNQMYYTGHTKPVQLDCKFVVNAADTGGLGITGLKGFGVNAVYMHTSQTPPAASPNPANGLIYVKLQDNYSQYYFGGAQWTAPTTGGAIKIDNSALTPGNAYVISTVGNATVAKWQAIGLPAGATPAVGLVFIATSNGGSVNTSTSRVKAVGVAGISAIELCGSPTQTVAQSSATIIAGNSNASWLVLQCLGSTFAGSALGSHTHDLLLKNAAVADGATTRVNAGTNLLGANTGSDITVTGAGANGGVVNASAGTPAGSITYGLVAPADGTALHLSFVLSSSSILNNGD